MPNILECMLALDNKAYRRRKRRLAGHPCPKNKNPTIITKSISMALLYKRGLIPVFEIYEMLGIGKTMVPAFVSMKFIQPPKVVYNRVCYAVEQLACFIQAKICATVNKGDGTSYVNMAMMGAYLKQHWPVWEAKYDSYEFSPKKDSRRYWSRGKAGGVKDGFWAGL